MYKKIDDLCVVRLADGACIPVDQQNSDYQTYLAWIAEGNTPAPTDPPTIDDYQAAVQKALDDKARERKYDGILSLCSYTASTNQLFVAEAAAGAAWRDAAWSYCYQALADVQNNLRTAPTVAELVAELPAMAWPT